MREKYRQYRTRSCNTVYKKHLAVSDNFNSGTLNQQHNNLMGSYFEKLINDFKTDKETIEYIRVRRDGSTLTEQKVLTEYIRHQIHHPENTHNLRFTEIQLGKSIELMRIFIDNQNKA